MWTNVSIRTRAEHAEALSEALLDHGALSVSVEDADAGTASEAPQFGEPGSPATPLWANSKVIALFAPAHGLIDTVTAAANKAGLHGPHDIALEDVAEENWVQLTQSQFEPIKIHARLWIVPSWHIKNFAASTTAIERSGQMSSPLSPERGVGDRFIDDSSGPGCILQLDPGMAFGTGSHPTTALCLEWLLDIVRQGDTLLDYGCGSGILGIAAAKLGADKVIGVEIDEQAIAAAKYNALQNKVVMDVRHSTESLPETFNLVVANILTNPLCLLAPLLVGRLAVNGNLALSGVLESQARQVIAAYAPYVALHVGDVKEGWCRLEGTNN